MVERLKQADIEGLWEPAAAGWVQQRPGPPRGEPAWFLIQRTGGRCVFLRDDDLCAVHSLLGEDAKPGFCRQFPYHLVDDPLGTVAVVRPMCAGFHRRFRDGEPVQAEAEAVAAMHTAIPRARFAPAQVTVAPGVQTDLDTWMDWEQRAITALLEHPDLGPDGAVALVRTTLYEAAGQPAPPARAEQAHAAATAICGALVQVLQAVLQQPGPPEKVAFTRTALERLEIAHARLRQGPLPEPHAELAAWAHLLLRSQLLAKQWTAWGSVDAGLGLFWIGWTIARAQHPDGDLEAVQPAYRHWLMLVANALVQHVLRRAHVALVDAFLHPR